MPRGPVTGGDLHVLWRVSHTALPQIENVYNEATKIHADTLADGGTGTFGRAFSQWQSLQQAAHDVLYRTAISVSVSRKTLDLAIREYTFVDADNSDDLTDAGEGFIADLEDPDVTRSWMDVDVEGKAHKPEKDD